MQRQKVSGMNWVILLSKLVRLQLGSVLKASLLRYVTWGRSCKVLRFMARGNLVPRLFVLTLVELGYEVGHTESCSFP